MGKDPIATWKSVKKAQADVSNTGKCLANIFALGQDHGDNNAKRAYDNVAGEACSVPIMTVFPKLHKPVASNGDPVTRPIVGAASGMTARVSNLLADILDCVVKGGSKQEEALSTEDVLSRLEDAATQVEEEGERIVVASVDVIGLYPNLDRRAAARQCNQEVVE